MALSGLAAVGCGDSDDEAPVQASPPNIERPRDLFITSEDISKAGRGTPAETLLRWWQALQFGDISAAREQYAGDVQVPGLATTAARVGALIQGARPIVTEKRKAGSTAKLLVFVQGADFSDKDNIRIVETPATFNFKREDGKWLLADNRYLTRLLATHTAAEQALGEEP